MTKNKQITIELSPGTYLQELQDYLERDYMIISHKKTRKISRHEVETIEKWELIKK